jgi:hypothetical protein
LRTQFARGTLAGVSVGWSFAAISIALVLVGFALIDTTSLDRQKAPDLATIVALWLAIALIGALAGLLSGAVAREATLAELQARATGVLALLFAVWSAWFLIRSLDPFAESGFRSSLAVSIVIATVAFRIPAAEASRFFPSIALLCPIVLVWVDKRLLESRYDASLRWSVCLGLISLVTLACLIAARQVRAPLTRERVLGAMPLQFVAVIALAAALDQPASMPDNAVRRDHARPSAPNVILVVLDTVRAKNMGLYGYHRDNTPFLRELAGDMTTYRGVASSDMTLSTHASMFTGLTPTRHGAHVNDAFVPTGWTGIPHQPGQPAEPLGTDVE